jgi:hypothetical protein
LEVQMTTIDARVTGRVHATPAAQRLARLTAHLIADERDDAPFTLAIRLAIDQLFRRDSHARAAQLAFAASALAALRDHCLSHEDECVVDLVEAACLLGAGDIRTARALVRRLKRPAPRGDIETAVQTLEAELAAAVPDPVETTDRVAGVLRVASAPH